MQREQLIPATRARLHDYFIQKKKAGKVSKTREYIFAIISGVLLVLAFPPLPFSLLAFVAMVPLLFVLLRRNKLPFLMLYATFFIYHAGTNWWISSWQKETDPYLMVSGIAVAVVHPFLFLLPFIAFFYIKRKIGSSKALWIFPFLWVAFEWLHSLGDLAYPWLALAYSQLYNFYWVQFADITGYWGVSFAIVMINVLVLKLILVLRSDELINSKRKRLTHPLAIRYSIPIILLLIVPNIYGIIRVNDFNHDDLIKDNKTINLGLVQPAINPWNKWESSPRQQLYKHIGISDSLISSIKRIDGIIWSETAILYLNNETNFEHNFSAIEQWINLRNISLLSGFADMKLYKEGEEPSIAAKPFRGDTSMIYDSYNSALLLNPYPQNTRNPQIYHKIRLTPFGERIPYMHLFSFARPWLEWGVGISSWDVGKEQKNLILDNGRTQGVTAPIICIESIYPDFVRDFINLGAEFITIITNDAWYDHTFGPEQHFQIARMRAIETRRYIARCANTGVTGFIKANGETLARAPQYAATGIAATIPLLTDKSLYVIYGEFLVYISLIVSLTAILFSVIHTSKKKP